MDARIVRVGVKFAVGAEIGLVVRVIAELSESKTCLGFAETINDLVVVDAAEICGLGCGG